MKPEPHRLQQDPPEGDPALIDRELARQDEKSANKTARQELSGQQKQPGEGPSSDERAAAILKDGAEGDVGQTARPAGTDKPGPPDAMDAAAPQTGTRAGP